MKPTREPHGICERIQQAQSVEELSALLSELDTYKQASNKTRNRSKKLANLRHKSLTSNG